MVSKASDDFPEPLKPVITTSLSRGIVSVRFFRLCSRAPPILINSLLTVPDFCDQMIGKHTILSRPWKTKPLRPQKCRHGPPVVILPFFVIFVFFRDIRVHLCSSVVKISLLLFFSP